MLKFAGSVLVPLLLLAACGGGEQGTNAVPGGRKVADLIAGGSCPIEVAGVAKSANPVAGAFVVRLHNRSDSPVGAIQWGVVALDASGNGLLDGLSEGGYDEETIGPGETVQGWLAIPREDAASAKVIIKSLLWYTPNPLGDDESPLPHVWRNPLYDAQLHGAQGIPAEE